MDANRMKQILCGLAVAALLIAPAFARAAPPVPPPSQAPSLLTLIGDTGGWVTRPQKSFAVRSVKIDGLVGTLAVAVKPDGPMTLDIAGTKDRVADLAVSTDGGVLAIEDRYTEHSVWDWHDWFNFSDRSNRNPRNLSVKLSVPKGADIDVDGLVGDATIGDTMGPLKFEAAAASNAKIGRVSKAKISLAGSGKIDVAEVAGPLDLDIAGSGKIHVGTSESVKADIAGSGRMQFGTIDGGLKVGIAGSGKAEADTVNGPVKVDIAGSGNVKIANGEAKPLHVSIMGSGNIDFGGVAVDPHISALGSGSVKLKAYSGHLSSSGNVNVEVNGKSVSVNDGDDDDNDTNDDD